MMFEEELPLPYEELPDPSDYFDDLPAPPEPPDLPDPPKLETYTTTKDTEKITTRTETAPKEKKKVNQIETVETTTTEQTTTTAYTESNYTDDIIKDTGEQISNQVCSMLIPAAIALVIIEIIIQLGKKSFNKKKRK